MSPDEAALQSNFAVSATAHRAKRRRTVVTACIVLIVLGAVGALLKAAVDRVRETAAQTTSV